jgi:PAS domain-containing protein
MPQKDIEIILARQLASYLAAPIFIVDPEGTLVFYNEPAELILGKRYDETGEMKISTWATIFKPMNEKGELLDPDMLPLVIAIKERRLAHSNFWIRGLDNTLRQIQVTGFPLLAQADRLVGAVAILWEMKE